MGGSRFGGAPEPLQCPVAPRLRGSCEGRRGGGQLAVRLSGLESIFYGQLQLQGRHVPFQAHLGLFSAACRWRRVEFLLDWQWPVAELRRHPSAPAALAASLSDCSGCPSACAPFAGLAQRQPPGMLQVLEPNQPELRRGHPSSGRGVAVSFCDSYFLAGKRK